MKYVFRFVFGLILGAAIGVALFSLCAKIFEDYWSPDGWRLLTLIIPALVGAIVSTEAGIGWGFLAALGIGILGAILAFIAGLLVSTGWGGVLLILLIIGFLAPSYEVFLVLFSS